MNNMNFTVVIPVYIKESAQNLKMALSSVLEKQTLKPTEVIIVEDGLLTEELYNILDHYDSVYTLVKRIRFLENKGVGQALQYAINEAKTEWIARMDSDDIALPNRFEKQVEFLKLNPDISVLGGAIEEFNDTIGDLGRRRNVPIYHTEIVKQMKARNPFNHMTVFLRKKNVIEAGGYQVEKFFEDYQLWYEMYKKGATFHNLADVLVYARVGNSMVSRRSGLRYFKFEKQLLHKFLNDGFISVYEYVYYTIIKYLLRVIPVSLLEPFYANFLREKVKK